MTDRYARYTVTTTIVVQDVLAAEISQAATWVGDRLRRTFDENQLDITVVRVSRSSSREGAEDE